MKKNYVLDTNVLIHTPNALESFEDNRIILPLAVLEELDGIKKADGEKGRNARQAIRFLEQFRTAGNLLEGVKLPWGGELKLEINHVEVDLPQGFKNDSPDNRILKVCKGMMNDGEKVILVTKDIMVRIKAQIMGIPVEDFTTDQVPLTKELYTGRQDVYVPDTFFGKFKKEGIPEDKIYMLDENGARITNSFFENEFFIIHSDTGINKTYLGRKDGSRIVPLKYEHRHPFGVTPKNVGQRFMQEALMMPAKKIPLVIIKGPAGTAKTFFSMAVGLDNVVDHNGESYRKILVCRPNSQFDEDIGFLPGSEQDKISPLMRPILDNIENLIDNQASVKKDKTTEDVQTTIDYFFNGGLIEAQAMNFMRGRSIKYSWLVIDEAQNLTPRQVKGIITRVGEGTKVVLSGDPEQIDNPLIDERSNGLSYAAEHMKGSTLCAQITLFSDECERSVLAFDAGKRM
ncbi:MAG: PhoH family protein [Treponema sp.]|jgi:PhoH-like ATPase|nr:PhoH family protein [Treponema sp.]